MVGSGFLEHLPGCPTVSDSLTGRPFTISILFAVSSARSTVFQNKNTRGEFDVRRNRTLPLVLIALWNPYAFASPTEIQHASTNQQESNVSGTWIITFSNPPHLTRTLVIQQNGNDITGTWDAPVCPCLISGTIKGDKLKLRITSHNPKALAIILISKVTSDSMTGKTHLDGGPGGSSEFTAVRQKKSDPEAAAAKK